MITTISNPPMGCPRGVFRINIHACDIDRVMKSARSLLQMLDHASVGKISRSEAAGWASSQGGGYAEPNPYRSSRFPRVAWEALVALKAATVSEDFVSHGEPYYIRNPDFAQLAAALRGEVTTTPNSLGIRPLRLHELDRLELKASFCCATPGDVAERLLIPSLRGIDDLDFYELVLFEYESETFMLEWYPRSAPDATICFRGETNADRPIAQLSYLLGLDPTQVTLVVRGA